MRASYYYNADYQQARKAIKSSINIETEEILIKELDKFFQENSELNYNEFLEIFTKKYGWFINNYRENKKMKSLRILTIAASFQIFFSVLAIISAIFLLLVYYEVIYL